MKMCIELKCLSASIIGPYSYVIKTNNVDDKTDMLVEISTEEPIDRIELQIRDLNEAERETEIVVNVRETVAQRVMNYFKKERDSIKERAFNNFFSGSWNETFYSIDALEYLPMYDLIKITGWAFNKNKDLSFLGNEKNTVLGYINYKRNDVSNIHKTDEKTGFEMICKLVDEKEAIEFGLHFQNSTICFHIKKEAWFVVDDADEQRIKAEQYYVSAPYKKPDYKKNIMSQSDKKTGVIVACNHEKWFTRILQQATELGNANLIIVANKKFKDLFLKIQKEQNIKCCLLFSEFETKEELRHYAVQHVKDEYIMFMEQEDLIDARLISHLEELLSYNRKVVCADYDLLYEDRHIVRVVRTYDSWQKENDLLKVIACMVRTELIKGLDNYEEIINCIKEAGLEKEWFASTNYIGYHYNCVENNWGNSENIGQIAFYLTQYHENEENNKWWGKGFTEWTNVTSGTPMFGNHHQPRVPGELGYYDLVQEKDILYKQTQLAREYGVDGFCFYYYWFNGKRLLRKPLDLFINNKDIDFNYCICWANESWTRRWDGLEQEVLMEQVHNEVTDVEFIYDVIPMFRDKRYIRINGKPLLLVYRMDLFPNPVETTERWREVCRKENIGEIHISLVQSFEQVVPEKYGADSATEFPPHKINTAPNICINEDVKDKISEFQGNIYSYEKTVNNLTNIVMRDYNLMQGSMLEWDNTARRKFNSNIFCEFSPELFKIWNIKNRFYTRLYNYEQCNCMFINAWNEWAEGSYLEPDEMYGRKMLEILKEVSNLK